MLHRLTSFPYSKPVSASKASSSRASPHQTLQDLDAATFCFKDTGREMWEVCLWGWTLAAAGVDVCGLGCSVLTLSAESQGMETYVSFNNERLLWLWQCSCVGARTMLPTRPYMTWPLGTSAPHHRSPSSCINADLVRLASLQHLDLSSRRFASVSGLSFL